MKARYIMAAVMLSGALAATAQETYENARLSTEDLDGTARYVGMGGALEALGADISTIGTNPAGIGLFRSSSANVSFGFTTQGDADKFAGESPTKMSFDQAGFVYSSRVGRKSFLNFAFNYHKSRNFNYILKAAGSMADGASQNKVSYNKGETAANEGWDFVTVNNDEVLSNDMAYSQVDYLYYNTILYNPLIDESGETYFYNYGADSYTMNRANTGYIGEYDFNISGNINDRVYLGLTVGIHDVHYSAYSEYTEAFSSNEEGLGGVTLSDYRKITGTGVDIKAGIIFRPVENSPFRVGLYFSTPTWYDLTTRNYTTLYVDDAETTADTYRGVSSLSIGESYEFKMYTPWKFGVSLGHTVGNCLAIGATYEYADYGNIDSRIDDAYDYGWDYFDESYSDEVMNHHTDMTLKGVSTLKIGLEYKPVTELAVRLGFNYISPMYEDYGSKDGYIESVGNYYQSATDYTNWDETYRVTAGLGLRADKFSFDLAYQYTQTDGTFYPFSDVLDDTNYAESSSVCNKRHQLIFTLGYSF